MKKNFALLAVALAFAIASCSSPKPRRTEITEFVTNRMVLPVNQTLTPAGQQVELPGMRPQVIALSPDGRLLVTSGKSHEIVVVDPGTGKIVQRVQLPSEQDYEELDTVSSRILHPDEEGQVSYTGLIFSHDGSRIFLSNVNGSVKVFGVDADRRVRGLYTIPMPKSGVAGRLRDIPSGLAVSDDGKTLYVAGNMSNRLLEFEIPSRKLLRTIDVGFAPYDVRIVGNKAYVSNWGGRRPDKQSVTGPAGHGTEVRVDPVHYIASEGSVSVVDLASGKEEAQILSGLHASGLCVSPDGKCLCVANAGSDTVSVIDLRSDTICETISLHWQPKDLLGASPNALTFDDAGKTLFICNGTQNAIAVVAFSPGKSRLKGLIPTGWYPGAIVHDARRHKIDVANIKGIGSGARFAPGEKVKLQTTSQYFGTLSLIPVPGKAELKKQTRIVWKGYQKTAMEQALLPPRPAVAPRAVPERVGEPSLIKHVVYIIKENRTYDQVLGDMKEGNGDASLCLFGEHVTPNQHKISRDFVLLDNTRCCGALSADGHQWADSGFVTDYLERSFAGFPRSYPDGLDDNDKDALAYSPAGFIWDNVLAHHKTLRVYGECTTPTSGWTESGHSGNPGFADFYDEYLNHSGRVWISCKPTVESLRPYINTNTTSWGLVVPDVLRAQKFIEDLHRFEREDNMPNLCILSLPNDHTGGTFPGVPTAEAEVADNDLAVGKIVEAISHGKFWKETCVFVIEDDPQNGFDHISSYRTTAYVASAYAKRHAVVHTLYNQTSILRTIELMLGLPPMNQMDATATPMFDCFTDTPNLTAYDVSPNQVPLDEMNPPVHAISDPVQKKFAIQSSRLSLDDEDDCPEDVLNRILWFAQKGNTPYPKWAVNK